MTATVECPYRYIPHPTREVDVPAAYREAVQQLMAMLPRDWDEVYAEPQFEMDGEGLPTGACVGIGFVFFQGDRYSALVLSNPPKVVADSRFWELCLEQVRRAFDRALGVESRQVIVSHEPRAPD